MLELKEKCPRCEQYAQWKHDERVQGYLIKRKGPYGWFLACDRWPACDFRKKLLIHKKELEKNFQKKIGYDKLIGRLTN